MWIVRGRPGRWVQPVACVYLAPLLVPKDVWIPFMGSWTHLHTSKGSDLTCTAWLTHKSLLCSSARWWEGIARGTDLKKKKNTLCHFSWTQGTSLCCVGGNVVDWFHWDPAKFWSCGHQRRIISSKTSKGAITTGLQVLVCIQRRHYLLKWDVEKEVSRIVNKVEREELFGDGEKLPAPNQVPSPSPLSNFARAHPVFLAKFTCRKRRVSFKYTPGPDK